MSADVLEQPLVEGDIDLSWVTVVTPDHDKACEREAFDCDKEAVYKVTFSGCDAGHPITTKLYCIPCYDFLSDVTDGVPIACGIKPGRECEEEVHIIAVDKIRRG
jgi:hypothetical protein